MQVPTTLLAQVDASVGGKSGVNHPGGKNMIGAFHQPRCVLVDTATLATLPEREYRAGLAEVVKYGVIWSARFFAELEGRIDALNQRDGAVLAEVVRESCAIKAAVVDEDEREHGRCAILNYGHTFAHALETLTGYEQLLHGEAVAIGMTLAADCAHRHGHGQKGGGWSAAPSAPGTHRRSPRDGPSRASRRAGNTEGGLVRSGNCCVVDWLFVAHHCGGSSVPIWAILYKLLTRIQS